MVGFFRYNLRTAITGEFRTASDLFPFLSFFILSVLKYIIGYFYMILSVCKRIWLVVGTILGVQILVSLTYAHDPFFLFEVYYWLLMS